MVNEQTYAPPLIETLRAQARAVFDAYMAATGLSRTFISETICGDPAWIMRLDQNGMTIKTYDRFMSRFSAFWPPGLAWPEGVPRQAPADDIEPIREKVEEAIKKMADLKQRQIEEAKETLRKLGVRVEV